MEESYKITYHKNNPTVDAEDVELYAVWKSRADLTEEDEGIDWSQKTRARQRIRHQEHRGMQQHKHRKHRVMQ